MLRSLSALVCALACAVPLALPAWGQVTTNDQALDALTPSAAPAHKAREHEARPAERSTHRRRGAPAVQKAAPAKRPPEVPAGPPANPVIAPPALVMPTHPPPPPPPVPLRADAAGAASAIPGGTRITFGAGVATLNPGVFKALQDVAAAAKANPTLVVTITAWAPGTTEDPSTPRRLSLDRALAARAVLINAGVASERIRAVAKGASDIGTGPADRVDVTEAGLGKS